MTVLQVYDRVMDVIAAIFFPSRRWVYPTMVAYVLAIGTGLSLYTGVWLWLPATALCAVLAWMIHEWFL